MRKEINLLVLVCLLSFVINGCSVRTYTVTRERIDQDLSAGNRGYLMGTPKATEDKPRKSTRELQVIEVEMRSSKAGKTRSIVTEAGVDSDMPAGKSSIESEYVPAVKTVVAPSVDTSKAMVMKKYTVQDGDTLQNISKRFYGTTKKWQEIYKVNQEILKSPDDIYPGQIIEIPVEELSQQK